MKRVIVNGMTGSIKEKIRKSFMKRVIVNGMTGSSWRFKRFGRLSLISTQANNLLGK